MHKRAHLLKVPNTQVMNGRILNLTYEGFIKYTFTVGFGHELSNRVILEECIQPAIDEFHERHADEQLRNHARAIPIQKLNRNSHLYDDIC